MRELLGVVGYARIRLYRGPALCYERFVRNTITDAGDAYHAGRVAAGIAPAALPAPAGLSGMKLGSGTLAAAKTGAGAILGAYIPGSNRTLDPGWPQLTPPAGPGGGTAVGYQCTWPAGVATGAIGEAVLVTDAAANADSPGAAVIARFVLTQTKGAAEELQILWVHQHLA